MATNLHNPPLPALPGAMHAAAGAPPSPPPTPPSPPSPSSRTAAHDALSDVFGSAPTSPTISPSLRAVSTTSPLSPSHSFTAPPLQRAGCTEPSDIPRLRAKHETEGYRDGVTAGKATSVQAGFDEAYPLGAALGLRVGRVLGLLDGCAAAMRPGRRRGSASDMVAVLEADTGMEEEARRVADLHQRATEELASTRILDAEYWHEDGTWRFEVEEERAGEDNVVLNDVAAAHPLIKRWEAKVDEVMETWGVDLTVMAEEEETELDENQRAPDATVLADGSSAITSKPPVTGAVPSRQALAW